MVPRKLLYHSLRRFEHEVGAGVFYLHPWELDVDSPTRNASGRWLLRRGRTRLAARLEELLAGHAFAPIEEVFRSQLDAEAAGGKPSPEISSHDGALGRPAARERRW